MTRYAYRSANLQLASDQKRRESGGYLPTIFRRKPKKLLHSSCTGQKQLIFVNYISDLQVTDIKVGETGLRLLA